MKHAERLLAENDLVLLNSKTVAALIGLSIWTLEHARCDRVDLDMPPSRKVGYNVVYPLSAVLRWAARRHVQLRWQDLPLRYALDAPDVFAGQHKYPPDALVARLLRL